MLLYMLVSLSKKAWGLDEKGSSKDDLFCCVNPETRTFKETIELKHIVKYTFIPKKPGKQ